MPTTNLPNLRDGAGPFYGILNFKERSCAKLHPNWTLKDEVPTVEQFLHGLGGWAIVLYVCSALTMVIVTMEYVWLIRHFMKNVPATRRVATLWVNSLYLIASIMSFFGVMVPQASDFVWLFYRVYLGMAMCYFVDITLQWFGGESEMVNLIGNRNMINFRVKPCCWCICCLPKETPLTRNKIRLLRGCVYQMPYVQTAMIFLLVVFTLSNTSTIGNLSPEDPYLYLMSGIMISFFIGLWGLFTVFGVTQQYEMLSNHQYEKKAGLFKTMVIMTNVQGFVIDSLVNYNIIPCVNEEISAFAMGCVIKSVLTMIESVVMGSITLRLYMIDHSHV